MDIGQTEVPALEAIGQFLVIDPHLVQQRRVKIVYGYNVSYRVISEFVGFAMGNAAFIFSYGAGQLAGPPVSGTAMELMNPGGLMIAFAATAALYLAIAGLVFTRRRH